MRQPLTLEQIDRFVADTRTAVFVRDADNLLMIRPDKTLSINASATSILGALYHRDRRSAAQVLDTLAPQLGVDRDRLLDDTVNLVQAVGAMLNEDFSPRPAIRLGTFRPDMVRYPTLAEIAVTYGCQNRCAFCYAASPHREGQHELMSTPQVQRVMDRIFHEAHVPSLSFTGGEATLRPDLPDLVRYGQQLGFRVNLITNGLRAADEAYAASLVQAGLASAQVSLESGQAALHDRIVGREGAFIRTVAGVRNFQRLGIHVHTNTTLCAANLDAAHDLIRFVARELHLRTLSMNMVIRTGSARGAREPLRSAEWSTPVGARGHDGTTGGDLKMEVSYTEIGQRIPALLETARTEGVRLVWYSPIPYCIFNPVLHGLGAKSCACVHGILSVDPSGQVLPCSSFERGIGSLLHRSYASISQSRAARYWRERRFLPPACEGCENTDVCAGGCPLYWDAAGSFAELPRPGATDPGARRRWERKRRRGISFGVPAPDQPCTREA